MRTKNPKTFIYGGHRYKIVYTTNTEANAKKAKTGMYNTIPYEHNPTAIKQLANGRWAVGIRQGKSLLK